MRRFSLLSRCQTYVTVTLGLCRQPLIVSVKVLHTVKIISLPGRFLSWRCFTLCITVEVEPRIAKQFKCQYCIILSHTLTHNHCYTHSLALSNTSMFLVELFCGVCLTFLHGLEYGGPFYVGYNMLYAGLDYAGLSHCLE